MCLLSWLATTSSIDMITLTRAAVAVTASRPDFSSVGNGINKSIMKIISDDTSESFTSGVAICHRLPKSAFVVPKTQRSPRWHPFAGVKPIDERRLLFCATRASRSSRQNAEALRSTKIRQAEFKTKNGGSRSHEPNRHSLYERSVRRSISI